MRRLRNLTHNIAIKVASLLLALLTWGYISGQLYKESSDKEKEASSIIEVSGEQIIVKRLPIYVNIEGSPAKDYEVVLDKIRIKPAYSVVAGPVALIKDLSYVLTEPIIIDGATGNVRKSVKVASVPKCTIEYRGPVNVTIPIIKQSKR